MNDSHMSGVKQHVLILFVSPGEDWPGQSDEHNLLVCPYQSNVRFPEELQSRQECTEGDVLVSFSGNFQVLVFFFFFKCFFKQHPNISCKYTVCQSRELGESQSSIVL